MEFIKTHIPDLFIIEPKVWRDDRGYFYESFSQKAFIQHDIHVSFVQDNQSLSQKGVLRGLHAQAIPFAQGKLVRVIQGAVLDIAVDARPNSPTFKQHVKVELSGENHRMLWIPAGFLHGFLTLEDNTIFTYKVTAPYHKESEMGVRWNDPTLGIDWGVSETDVLVSEKDISAPLFDELFVEVEN